MTEEVVVGLELDLCPKGMYLEGPLVLGYIAIFESRSVRVSSLYALVELFDQFHLHPARVPDEVGWDSVMDLGADEWYELQALLARRQLN